MATSPKLLSRAAHTAASTRPSAPLRNALPGEKSRLQSRAWAKRTALAGRRLLAALAGVGEEPLTWRLIHDESLFENQVATLEIEGRSATITFEGGVLEEKEPGLKKLYRHRLA